MDKVFNFNSDLQLIINEENITLIHEKGKNKISSENFDKISYELYWENKISPAGLFFRIIVISFVLLLITPWKFNIFILIVDILLFLILFFDSFLELDIYSSIVNRFFSNNYYYVEISSKTSNNIKFYVLPDELNKIIEVEKYLNDLKNRLIVKYFNENEKYKTLNYHEELKKLGELLNSGLITQVEFDLKKKQILGL